MAGKHRIVKIYQGMSKRAKAAVVGSILVAGMAGGTLAASAATSTPTVVPVSITNVTQSELDFNGHGSYELQVVNQDTGKQVVHTKSGGLVKVTGLSAGTAYEWRTVRGTHWGLFETAFTTAAAGAAGLTGDPGATAELTNTPESGSASLPNIGGSWSKGHAVVKSFTLDKGTYMVTLSGDFYKTATTTATPVLQIQANDATDGLQLTAYTGAFPYNAAETVGVGTDGTPNGLEQTASAYGVFTVAADNTPIEIDAFGYNPDRSSGGSGDFAVNAHLNAVKIG